MNARQYGFIENLEQELWWFKARREIVLDQILKYKKHPQNLFDIGCGSGYFIKEAREYIPVTMGLDSHEYGTRQDENIIIGDATNISVEKEKFDVVTALDLIEHIEHPEDVLSEAKRILRPNGIILVAVPALQWLYSNHDKENGHIKRYNKKGLIALADKVGLKVEKVSYFNTILFPVEAGIRLLERVLKRNLTTSDKIPIYNNLLYNIFRSERALLNRGGAALRAECNDNLKKRIRKMEA